MLCRRTGGRPAARRAKGRVLSALLPRAGASAAASPAPGEPLTLAHRAELEPLLAARWAAHEPPEYTLSDPWFANLYLFRAVHGWRLLRGPLLGISGRSYDGARILLPLQDLQQASSAALHAVIEGHDAFGPLSQAQAERLDGARFAVHSARDDADYLYPADHFLHYRGTALNKKRNLVKQLHSAHRVDAVPYTEALADEARQVVGAWLQDKSKQPGETDDAACLEALSLSGTLGLQGFLHRVGGRPVGFVLAEPIRPGVAVMRFAKGLDDFKGIYPHMFQHFCRNTPAVRWLNFEQDLGLANFRRTKLSYRPAALLAKVRVTLRC